jgi:hypothetical protein
MIFGFSILATAILLSCVAAYYSVAGLTAIFSAATIPVIIMGGSLELGKIVATVWLHNNWRRAPILFKAYLVPAVAFLMLLTSMGIFGYLSKAHSDQSLVSGDAVAKVAIYDEKIKISRDNIEADRKALKQMDEAVDQVMGRSNDEKGADKAVAIRRGQQKERARILADIEAEQKKITNLNEERAPLAAEFRKVESEVGPIKYIAALVYGDNPDSNVLEKAVRLMIIMIVLVFDPLALTLILAANKQFEWARAGTGGFVHDEPRYEPDDGPLTDNQIDQLKSSVDPNPPGWMFDKFAYLKEPFVHFKGLKPIVASPEPPDDPIPCYKCGTPLEDAPGIGLFCPNKECDVIDNVNGEEPIELVVTNSTPADNVSVVEEPDLTVYNDERLVSKFDKIQDVERPGDYVTLPTQDDEESPEIKAAIKKWKIFNPDDTLKNQRQKLLRGEIDELPWMKLLADNVPNSNTSTGFGVTFPDNPNRGDTFVKVDQIPNVVYKFNGSAWIEVDKSLTDSYTYNNAYIDHLIEKLESGEYDPELLSDGEREQVAFRLTH